MSKPTYVMRRDACKAMLRLTERAVQALVGAEQLAWQEGRPRVEPTHLLRAILARPDSMACRVLAALGLDREAAASALGERAPGDSLRPGQAPPAESLSAGSEAEADIGRVPFTDTSKGVLERAAQEGYALGHRYIGTEHLLLGLLATPGEPGQTLRRLGVDPEGVRQALRAMQQGPAM